MEELVPDLLSALHESMKQTEGGLADPGDHSQSMACPPQSPPRKRKRKTRRSDNTHPPSETGPCLSDGSDSPLEELGKSQKEKIQWVKKTEQKDHSDSDDYMFIPKPRSSFSLDNITGECSFWHVSHPAVDNIAKRAHRRRRKVTCMEIDQPSEVSTPLTLTQQPEDGEQEMDIDWKSYQHQEFSNNKRKRKLNSSRPRLKIQDGAMVSKREDLVPVNQDTMEYAEQKGSDAILSDSDISSLSSTDDGLFASDQGRQADDEQSDYFYENKSSGARGSTGAIPGGQSEESMELGEELRDAVFQSMSSGSFTLMPSSEKTGVQDRLQDLHEMPSKNITQSAGLSSTMVATAGPSGVKSPYEEGHHRTRRGTNEISLEGTSAWRRGSENPDNN